MKMHTFRNKQHKFLGTMGPTETVHYFEADPAGVFSYPKQGLNHLALMINYPIGPKKVVIDAVAFSMIDVLSSAGGIIVALQAFFAPISNFLSQSSFELSAIAALF